MDEAQYGRRQFLAVKKSKKKFKGVRRKTKVSGDVRVYAVMPSK